MLRFFIERKTVWWPTRWGWLCFCGLIGGLVCTWILLGEAFLSPTHRLAAEVLVVEGTAGRDSLAEALVEFHKGGYRLVVTAGGPTGGDWRTSPWNYAELAAEELKRMGMAPEEVIAAPARQSNGQRTYQAACAVRRILEARGAMPSAVNLWSRGAHARRSRLVYAKALRPQTQVGVIAWNSPDDSGPWWRSGDRSREFFEESLGYWYERLLNSGRW